MNTLRRILGALGILLIVALGLCVGLQQRQIQRLRQQLDTLHRSHAVMDRELQMLRQEKADERQLALELEVNARPPTPAWLKVVPASQDSHLRFPIEVERAMMGDAFKAKQVVPVEPVLPDPPVLRHDR